MTKYRVMVSRKVRGIDSTLYLALPRFWCVNNGLQKNDMIQLELLSERELLVRVPEK